MENDNITIIVPDYLDKPLNEEEEKVFFSDLESDYLENEQLEIDDLVYPSDWVSKSEYEKVVNDYFYQKSLIEYNAIVEEQNEVNANYLNQIANCSLYTLAFVGVFFLFYLLSLIVKFFKSILDF